MIDCRLTPDEQIFIHIMARASNISMG